jgi:ubiquinone biosynthesis protein UbiJ
MREYRTPLPQVFASSLEAAINRVLALDATAAKRLERLEGRVLQLEVEGLGITLFMTARHGAVHINLDSPGEPDTVIRGTPLALFAMAAPGDVDSWGLPGSRVHISGDANLARDMERVFRQLDPDWEGQLAVMFGDVLGFQISSGLKQGAAALREALRSTTDMAGAYLREEATVLIRPAELESFRDEVAKLDEALSQLEERLTRLRDAGK